MMLATDEAHLDMEAKILHVAIQKGQTNENKLENVEPAQIEREVLIITEK